MNPIEDWEIPKFLTYLYMLVTLTVHIIGIAETIPEQYSKMKNVLNVILKKKDGGKLSQYLAVISADLLIFTAGIHGGWASPSIKKLLAGEHSYKITEQVGSNIAIIGYLGDILGGICGSSIIDKFGRKNTLIFTAIPFIMSFLLISMSDWGTPFLYAARVLGGLGEGASIAILPLYVAEVADPGIRGKLGTFQMTTIFTGNLFINVISEYFTIPIVALICLTFPILFIILFSQMPETPYYFLSKNRKTEAMESLIILRRTSKVEKELDILECDVQRQMSERGGYKELFSFPVNRKAFILANTTRFFQQMTGCTAFFTYFQILIQNASDIPPMLGTSILLLTQVILTFLSYYFIDLYGRRTLLLLSSSLTSIVLFILSGFMIVRDFTNIDVSHLQLFPLVMIFLFVVTFTVGSGAVTTIFTAEMYSTSIKAPATALSCVNLSLLMMGTVKFFQYTSDNISLAVPFVTFGTFTFVSVFFFYFCLIETKGKSLETILKELATSNRD